jgi:hypothetical protein
MSVQLVVENHAKKGQVTHHLLVCREYLRHQELGAAHDAAARAGGAAAAELRGAESQWYPALVTDDESSPNYEVFGVGAGGMLGGSSDASSDNYSSD